MCKFYYSRRTSVLDTPIQVFWLQCLSFLSFFFFLLNFFFVLFHDLYKYILDKPHTLRLVCESYTRLQKDMSCGRVLESFFREQNAPFKTWFQDPTQPTSEEIMTILNPTDKKSFTHYLHVHGYNQINSMKACSSQCPVTAANSAPCLECVTAYQTERNVDSQLLLDAVACMDANSSDLFDLTVNTKLSSERLLTIWDNLNSTSDSSWYLHSTVLVILVVSVLICNFIVEFWWYRKQQTKHATDADTIAGDHPA